LAELKKARDNFFKPPSTFEVMRQKWIPIRCHQCHKVAYKIQWPTLGQTFSVRL